MEAYNLGPSGTRRLCQTCVLYCFKVGKNTGKKLTLNDVNQFHMTLGFATSLLGFPIM